MEPTSGVGNTSPIGLLIRCPLLKSFCNLQSFENNRRAPLSCAKASMCGSSDVYAPCCSRSAARASTSPSLSSVIFPDSCASSIHSLVAWPLRASSWRSFLPPITRRPLPRFSHSKKIVSESVRRSCLNTFWATFASTIAHIRQSRSDRCVSFKKNCRYVSGAPRVLPSESIRIE